MFNSNEVEELKKEIDKLKQQVNGLLVVVEKLSLRGAVPDKALQAEILKIKKLNS